MSELKKKLKKLKWDSIVISIISIAVGVACVCFPASAGNALCLIAGIGLLIAGVTSFIRYVAFGGFLLGGYGLILSLTTVAVGSFCIARPETVARMLTVLIGVFIIVESAQAMSEGVACARIKMCGSAVMIICSAITLVLGVLLMFSGAFDAVMLFAGISLIIDGVKDFIFTLVFADRVKKARSELYKYSSTGYLGDGSEE